MKTRSALLAACIVFSGAAAMPPAYSQVGGQPVAPAPIDDTSDPTSLASLHPVTFHTDPVRVDKDGFLELFPNNPYVKNVNLIAF